MGAVGIEQLRPASGAGVPGRADASSELLGLAAAGLGGRLRVALVVGPAGIGKTALVDAVLDDLAPLDDAPVPEVLRAGGDPDETSISFGVLEQLGVLDGAVPPGAEAAAQGASLVAELGRPDRAGWVLVVEDVQWVDPPSLAALGFALRRLTDTAGAVLLTTRDPDALPPGLLRLIEGPSGTTLLLGGLDLDGARAAVRSWGWRPSEGVLRRLLRHTGGNPRHLRIALAGTSPSELLDPGDLPPASLADLDTAVRSRVAALGSGARSLVEATAVCGGPAPLALLAAAAGSGAPTTDLQEAVAAELISSGSRAAGPVGMDHVTRAAVYHHLDLPRRATLHRRIAALVDDPRKRVRHLLAAADRFDGGLAGEAAALAASDSARGAWRSAAEWELGVARCAPDAAVRRAAAGRAAHSLVVAGDPRGATSVLDEFGAAVAADLAALVRGRVAAAVGDLDGATEELERSWELGVAAGSPASAAAASHLAAVAFARARGDRAAMWARRAIEQEPAGLAATDVDPTSRLLLSLVIAGRAHEAALEATAATPDDAGGDPRVDGSFGRAVVASLAGDPATGERSLAAVAHRARREGPLSLWAFVQCWRSAVAFRSGRWDEALVQAARVTMFADDGAHSFDAAAHACLAVVLAARGRAGEAHTELVLSREAARRAGAPELVVATADGAAAWIAHASGDHTAVLELTGSPPLVEVEAVPMLAAPPAAVLRGLAAVRTGDLDEVDRCRGVLEGVPLPWGAWSVALGGLAAHVSGDAARGCAALERAHDALEGGPHPLDAALVGLELGALHRRARHRGPAAAALARAEAELVALGAVPFAERSRSELSMLGRRPPVRHDAGTTLTPTEQVVADLAASGLANKEIAADLVVSVKTVEFHLGNVFRKLDVSNRTQLAVRMQG